MNCPDDDLQMSVNRQAIIRKSMQLLSCVVQPTKKHLSYHPFVNKMGSGLYVEQSSAL